MRVFTSFMLIMSALAFVFAIVDGVVASFGVDPIMTMGIRMHSMIIPPVIWFMYVGGVFYGED